MIFGSQTSIPKRQRQILNRIHDLRKLRVSSRNKYNLGQALLLFEYFLNHHCAHVIPFHTFHLLIKWLVLNILNLPLWFSICIYFLVVFDCNMLFIFALFRLFYAFKFINSILFHLF